MGKFSEVSNEDLWRTMAEMSDAMSGISKLYAAVPPVVDVFDRNFETKVVAELQVHLGALDRLRGRFDDIFFELEQRYSKIDETGADPE